MSRPTPEAPCENTRPPKTYSVCVRLCANLLSSSHVESQLVLTRPGAKSRDVELPVFSTPSGFISFWYRNPADTPLCLCFSVSRAYSVGACRHCFQQPALRSWGGMGCWPHVCSDPDSSDGAAWELYTQRERSSSLGPWRRVPLVRALRCRACEHLPR